MQSGKTEFQRKWGSRKLEDNWRRRNKQQFDTSDFDAPEDAEGEELADGTQEAAADSISPEEKEKANRAADPHYPEYYMAQIPFSEEQKTACHEIIQDGLYNMGVILKDKLEDFNSALSQFSRLLNDYPDNTYRLDVYYNLYLMYMRQGDELTAETYRLLILSEFADSPYGLALKNPNYIDDLRGMDQYQANLYDATYQAYLDNDNRKVHAAYEEMNTRYPLSKIMPKFMFLHALAYVTERKPDEFNAVLRELLERYPDTDITPIASAWLKGMAAGKELQSGTGGNMRGMIWDQRLTNDSTLKASGEANFELNLDEKQLLVLTFQTNQVSSNMLLYELARHNFNSFVVKDFDLEQLNFGLLGLIVIRDFENMGELEHYVGVMANSKTFKMPVGVRPVVISDKNFQILISQGRSFDEYFRFLQEQNYVDTQVEVLMPEDVETLDEADQAAEILEAEAEAKPVEEPQPEAEEVSVPVQEPEPAVEPASTPEVEPQPVAKPEAAQPASKPATKPAAKPAPKKEESKQPTVIVPTPKRNAVPVYAPGSEGDDPLLE